MGWAGGTEVFDTILSKVLEPMDADIISTDYLIEILFEALTEADWDTCNESSFWYNPKVQAAVNRVDASWLEEEDE